jgi:hypothetical protein
MMPEAQSVKAFSTWWGTYADRLLQGFLDGSHACGRADLKSGSAKYTWDDVP